jgi:hypothetical protein
VLRFPCRVRDRCRDWNLKCGFRKKRVCHPPPHPPPQQVIWATPQTEQCGDVFSPIGEGFCFFNNPPGVPPPTTLGVTPATPQTEHRGGIFSSFGEGFFFDPQSCPRVPPPHGLSAARSSPQNAPQQPPQLRKPGRAPGKTCCATVPAPGKGRCRDGNLKEVFLKIVRNPPPQHPPQQVIWVTP